MTDKMTPSQRSYCMSRIRANDTKPEMIVRRFLWSHGYRYRLHRKSLPGTPDIVISRIRTVILINGCFWHGHSCKKTFPATNRKFWEDKIDRNRRRDFENGITLRNLGWNVITIWECELKKNVRDATLKRLLATLKSFEATKADTLPAPAGYTYPEPEYYPIAAEPTEDYSPDYSQISEPSESPESSESPN